MAKLYFKRITGAEELATSTLMTSLTRLADKGFISCDRSTGRNLYTSIISEKEYKTGASKHFLEKLYNNSIQNMITALYDSKEIKNSDIEELRNFWINWRMIDGKYILSILGISVSIGLIVIGLILLTPFLSKKVCRKVEIHDLDFSFTKAACSF